MAFFFVVMPWQPAFSQSAPAIITQPQSFTESAGYSAGFSVVASGQATLYYQWYRNSVAISAATNSTCSLSALQMSQAGNYSVTVSNTLGSVTSSNAVLIVPAPDVVATVGGASAQTGTADGPGGTARFSGPFGVAVDASNNVYVADSINATIRRLAPAGTNWVVSTLAGLAQTTGSADGTNSAARFFQPRGVAVDGSGNVYVADSLNHLIRKMVPVGTNWIVTTLAGWPGSTGTNDGFGSIGRFNQPRSLAVDGYGNIYVADDMNFTVRKIGTNGYVSTLAGWPGVSGTNDGVGSSARFTRLAGLALDAAGNIYVTDYSNHAIRKLAPVGTNWVVSTLAGLPGTYGSADGLGAAARFYYPSGIAVDLAGNVLVGDASNHTLRKLTPVGTNWVVTTLAGLNVGGGDGIGSTAQFQDLAGLAVDGFGGLFVAESAGDTIRKAIPANPLIQVQPLSQLVVSGTNVTLSVVVAGAAPLACQWQYDGVNVAGATNVALTLTNLTVALSGRYLLVITNSFGSVTSSVATVAVPLLYTAVNGGGQVQVTPATTNYIPGQTLNLSAVPGRYYAFVQWSDGVTNNPRLIVMNSTNVYTAVFTNIVPLETVVLKQWEVDFGGGGNDYLTCLQPTGDGGYIVGGYSNSDPGGSKASAHYGGYDYWVVRLDAGGNKLWEKSFGGSGDDYCQSLQLTSDGGFILGGTSASGVGGNKTSANFGSNDYWMVRLDAGGNKLWEASFGGSGDDQFYRLQPVSDGGFILGGLSNSGQDGNKTGPNYGSYDMWVVRVDANGNKVWDATYGGGALDELTRLQPTADGGFIFGGLSASSAGGTKSSPFYGGPQDYWVVKTDANGSRLWDNSFGGSGDDALFGLQQTADGGYMLGGYSSSSITGNRTASNYGGYDFWLVRADAGGNKLGDYSFGGTGDDGLRSLIQTPDGGFLLGGYSASVPGGSKTSPNYGGPDCWVVKLDGYGNEVWDYSFGGTGDEDAGAIQLTTDGGFILGGTSASGINGNKTTAGNGGNDYWVVKAFPRVAPVGMPLVLVNGQYSPSNSFAIPATNTIQVSLQTTYPGGYLFYTLDGTDPDNESTPCTGPFTVSQPLVVRAIAYNSDGSQFSMADPVTISIVPICNLTNSTPGGGSVAFSPAGGIYLSNALVTATATASNGWSFMGWQGAASSTNNPVAVSVVISTNLGAIFGTTVATATNVAGAGVALWPPQGPYPFGGAVRFVGVPPAGKYFAHWFNIFGPTNNPYNYVVTSNNPVASAFFSNLAATNFTLTTLLNGSGWVTCSPPANYYASNSAVQLTAVPDAGNLFVGWSNSAAGTQNPLSVVANSNLLVTAIFVPLAPPAITSQPQSLVVNRDSNAVFTVGATGGPLPAYQWYHNGTNLAGAVASVLNIGSAQVGDAGSYFVVATNIYGSVTSSVAVLTVSLPFTFVTLAGQAGWAGTNDGQGIGAWFNSPYGVALDGSSNVYVADFISQTIRQISPAGSVTTVAGLAGVSGTNNGTGNAARFNLPYDVAVDSSNNVYVADAGNNTIRKMTPAGVVTTLAGLAGVSGTNDGTGTAARFNYPCGLAVDGSNNVYVVDQGNQTIRKVTAAGVVTTVAGLAGVSGTNNGPVTTARFNQPSDVAVDNANNVYVVDQGNQTIRKVSAGVVTTLAGSVGLTGTNDGAGAAARFNYPNNVVVDPLGNLYVSDSGNHSIRKITSAGLVTTVGGLGGAAGSADGPVSVARFNNPDGVALDGAGNLYVADTGNNTIRKGISDYGQPVIYAQMQSLLVSRDSNAVFTVGATGGLFPAYRWYHNGTNLAGAAGPVLTLGSAQLGDAGSYFVVVTNNYGSVTSSVVVLTVSLPYSFVTLAGQMGVSGTNDGLGSNACFNLPYGVAADGSSNVYVADLVSQTIRKMTSAGSVTTVAGLAGISGTNNGTGNAARFNLPFDVAVDGSNNVYVADAGNNTIRKMTPAGAVTTLAGLAGVSGTNDGTGSAARFYYPYGLAVDGSNNVYVVDQGNHTIRKVTAGGVVTTVAGLSGKSGSVDGPVTAARFNQPADVAVDRSNNVYVVDQGNQTIRKVSAGMVTTLAGAAGLTGTNDGAGAAARFNYPNNVVMDPLGNLYVTDSGNNTIRKITPAGMVTTVGGLGGGAGSADGPGYVARFNEPDGVALDGAGNLYVADTGNSTIRKGIPDYGQPLIYVQPQGRILPASAAVTLSVSNSGALPLGYQWLFNGTNLPGATSGSLSYASFQFGNAGPYCVVITNVYGGVTSSVAVLSLQVATNNQPPAVAITSPVTGATFTAPVNLTLTAAASDADGAVAQVTFLNGAVPLAAVAGGSPFNFVWTNAPVGTNPLTAVARDNGGLSTTSAPVSVIVQTALPQVALLSPTNNASYLTNVSIFISAIASDADNSLARVELYSQAATNGASFFLLSAITNPPYNFTWSGVVPGSYTLTARAVDAYGPIVTSAPVNLTVTVPATTNPPVFLFGSAGYSVNESNGVVVVTVLNTGDLGGLVNYTTVDGTAFGGSGYSGSYTKAQGALLFAGGQHSTNLTIGIRDNFITGPDLQFSVQLFNPSAGILGTPSATTVTIHQNDVGGATNSLLATASPTAQPATAGALAMVLSPPEAAGQWRFPWEQGWHQGGDVVSGLEAGNYPVQFRVVPNYLPYPAAVSVAVTNGGTTIVTNQYLPAVTSLDTNSTGSLTVNIGPNVPSGSGWRFIGESSWRSPGSGTSALLPDTYFIEYAPVGGWTRPASQAVAVFSGQATVVSANYLLATSLPSGAATPAQIVSSLITDIKDYPYGFNGQLYTDAGYGSGVAVRESVVLTAAHMVFNDASLSYSRQAYWTFQNEAGVFSPEPLAARGWYVLSGYAAQRTNDLTVGGYGLDQSSSSSRNLDVAALYFLSPVARGGYGGYLASDVTPNPWLTGSNLKMLVGYPVDGSYYGQTVQPGTMYATTAQPTALALSSNNVYSASWFLSYPGNSGGPLYVLFNGYYYPAAVYLGSLGSGQNTVSVVRAINSEVVNLINLAASEGDSGTNFTGGGVITLVAGSLSAGNPAYLQVRLAPPAAVSAGAGWRLHGDSTYGTAANYTRVITTNGATVEFKPVSGWNPPAAQSIQISAGTVNVITNLSYTVVPPWLVVDPVHGLALTGATGTTYRIEYRTSLVAGSWLPLKTNTLGAGVNTLLPWPLTNGPAAFYRVVWLP